MVFFSAILTVATIVQAFFIHDANEISRRAAVAAETAAKAARDSVDMAKSGQKSADEALAATRSIAVANQKSAEATERTAAILDKVSNAAAESNQTAKTSADAAQKTANALEKSLEMEKDTAQKSLRAYVYVGASAMTFTPAKDGKGGELETTLTIDNKGVTFAHDVIISSNLICVPTSFKGPFDLNLFGHSTHQDLGPAGNFQLKTKAIIDSVQWKGYTAGTHTAWIFGEITYTDDFKVKHHSHFRFKPTDSLSSTIPRTWLLIYADQGNDSD